MRAGIGLLSLLIVAATIFYLSFGGKKGGYEGQVLTQGRDLGQQASQLSGNDHPEESIVLQEEMSGSELRAVKVVSVVSGGPMATAYGLQPGDEIIQARQVDLRGMDPGLAKIYVTESYSMNAPLVIRRNDQELTLKPDTALTKFNGKVFGQPGAVLTH